MLSQSFAPWGRDRERAVWGDELSPEGWQNLAGLLGHHMMCARCVLACSKNTSGPERGAGETPQYLPLRFLISTEGLPLAPLPAPQRHGLLHPVSGLSWKGSSL